MGARKGRDSVKCASHGKRLCVHVVVVGALVLLLTAGCSSFNTLETKHYQTGIARGDRQESDWGLNLFAFGIRYGDTRFGHWGPIFPYLPGFPLLSFEWERNTDRFST